MDVRRKRTRTKPEEGDTRLSGAHSAPRPSTCLSFASVSRVLPCARRCVNTLRPFLLTQSMMVSSSQGPPGPLKGILWERAMLAPNPTTPWRARRCKDRLWFARGQGAPDPDLPRAICHSAT